MFPIPWNFPFRKKNGDLSTIGDMIGSGGGGSDLPPHSASDAGKLLGVKLDGSLEWSDEVNSEIQTLTNYANAQSNPNLLDNPWFTVNQRGQSSYTGSVYGFDRWRTLADDLTVSRTNDVMTLERGATSTLLCFLQYIENLDDIRGKTATISILLSDDTIEYATFIIPSATDAIARLVELDGFGALVANFRGNKPFFGIGSDVANASLSFKAIKLELGSVSTLASDTAPNYATELLKCQRYFQALAENTNINYGVGIGQARTTTKAEIHVPLACQMRTQPTIIFSGGIKLRNASTVISVINIAVECPGRNEILLAMEATGLTEGAAYSCFTYQDGVLQLSADL